MAEATVKERTEHAPATSPAHQPRVAAPAGSVVAAQAAAAKAAAPPEPARLEERFFHSREIKQNEWYAIAYSGLALADILKREYWANLTRKLKQGDKIVVVSEDMRLYVELIVFAVGSNWAHVEVLGAPIMVNAELNSLRADYEIRNLGLIKKWSIIRSEDGREIKADGTLHSFEQAAGWLNEFLRQQYGRSA